MKKLLFIFALFATMLVSCSSNELPQEEFQSSAPTDKYFVTLEEALESADAQFTQLNGTRTRSKGNVTTEILRKSSTRGEDENSLYGFYIVNYDPGFAIISADRRRPAV